MAFIQTVERASTRYRVRWYEAGVRRSRNFENRSEAEAFAATMDAKRLRRGQRGYRIPMADRIGSRVDIDAAGCWIWTGTRNNAGYGQLTVQVPGSKPRTMLAHRLSYEEFEGQIPEGLVIDHLCRVRECVNPLHLETVTQRENVMRSPVAPGALNAAKTHCPQGHPYDAANTQVYRGQGFTGRLCKACASDRYHARKAVTS